MKTIAVLDRNGKDCTLTVELGVDSLRYTAKTTNTKTGNIPTQWVGGSLSESEATCSVCPLMQDKTCYSQYGTPKMGHNQLLKASAKGKVRTVESAIAGKSKTAKVARMAAIGDPGSIAREVYETHDKAFRDAGLGVLSYTHQWYLPHAAFLKNLALASADTWQDVLDAKAEGWRVALHIDNATKLDGKTTLEEKPQGTVDGIKYFLCPAQRGKAVQCNDCGLCDAKKKTNVDVIIFLEHGVAMKASKK